MPINTQELLSIVAELADENEMRVAVTGSLKGAALTGATTFLGGLLLGPIGLAIGGIAGGVTAAAVSQDSFRSLGQVIREMSPRRQALLISRVNNVLREFSVTDLALLLPLLQGNVALRDAVTRTLVTFVQKELNYRIA